jgi:hypothetical protein
MLQRSSGFLPPVPTTCRVGFGVFSVKPGCHSSGSIRNLLVYLPPAHRVKKTGYSIVSCFEGPAMLSRMVGSGGSLFRSRTLGRKLSSNRRKMVTNIYANAMTSITRPCRASTKRGAMRGANTKERGGFISNRTLQCGQTRCVQASSLKKTGVRTA